VVEDFKAGQDLAKAILDEAGYTLEGDRLHYPDDQKEEYAQ
jgi:peptide/nickel transport system substrate-binding protein